MDRFETPGETRARLLGLVRRRPRSVRELAEVVATTRNVVRTHVPAEVPS